jgi:hypothetical protein
VAGRSDLGYDPYPAEAKTIILVDRWGAGRPQYYKLPKAAALKIIAKGHAERCPDPRPVNPDAEHSQILDGDIPARYRMDW